MPLHSTVSTTDISLTAAFSADQTTIYEYQTVTFTDSSTGSPDEWTWTFGSGEGGSTDQNPSHQYTTPGLFTIVLNATNTGTGLTDIETKTNYITVLCSPVVASFTTNTTNGEAPLVVGFTSTSLNATSWEWDFDSDGDIDSTDENPTWTYPSVGFWTPTLTVYGNGTCLDYEVKEDYIYIAMTGSGDTGNLTSGYGYQYPPKDVRFKVMSMFGQPIEGCSVQAQGITTTTGSWDWLVQLFGVSLTETPIMNTSMAGTTDSNGEIVFLMIPSVKYNMSFVRSGEINQLFYITPKDEYYNIYSTTGGESYYEHGYDYNAIVNITLSTTDFGASDDYITVTYVDTLSQTTNATIYIYQTATTGESLVNTTEIMPGGSFTESLLVTDTPGHSYHIRVSTTHTTFGSKVRDFIVTFPDTGPETFGFPSELLIFFAIFILIFVGCFFGAASATSGSLIVCFVGWILYAIGWLNSLGAAAPVALSAATAFSIFAIIAKMYREDR
jgi:PKD repeat protein